MSELSFLIELLLNHELQKETKDLIAARIKEVEERFNLANVTRVTLPQSGYMQLSNAVNDILPEHMAQTPAAAKALQERQQMIRTALAGKAPPKNRAF